MPHRWTWAAPDGTDQNAYNHARLQYWSRHECQYVIKHCDRCKSTGLLVGQDEIRSDRCDTCLEVDQIRNQKKKAEMEKVCNISCIILIF